MEHKHISISIKPGTFFLAGIAVGLFFLASKILDLFLIVLFSLILASGISAAQKFFNKFGMNRVVSIIFIYIIIFLLFTSVIYLLIPIIADQTESIVSKFPQTFENISGFIQSKLFAGSNINLIENLNTKSVLSNFSSSIKSQLGNIQVGISFIFGGLLDFLLILVFTFFFAVQPQGVSNFIKGITPRKYKKYVVNLWDRFGIKMGYWLQGQLLLSTITAVLMFLGFVLIGVPNAFVLALLAGLFEFLPVFGPFVASIPPLLLLIASGDFYSIIFLLVLVVLVQQIQQNLVYPIVVQKIIGVPSTLVILAIVAGVTLGGVIGLLLSIPLAVLLKELYKDIQSGYFTSVTQEQNIEPGTKDNK